MISECKELFLRPFRALAVRILRLFPDRGERDAPGIAREIESIRPGEKDAVRNYYEQKLTECLAAAFLLLLAAAAVFAADALGGHAIEGNRLERPSYGAADAQEEVIVLAEGETEEMPLQVRVQARRYTEAQEKELLDEALGRIEEELTGENVSADEVRGPLCMRESYCGGAVSAEWLTIPYGMISDTGEITGEPEEEGSLVELRAVLTCQERTAQYQSAVRVYPPVLTKQETFWKQVRDLLEKTDDEEAEQDALTLPSRAGERALIWKRGRSSTVSVMAALLLLIPLLLWFWHDQEIHEEAKNRETQLMLDYSDLMWKLTMLLGAGLTIRGAFERIGRDCAASAEKRYAYEEVYFTCMEMKSGVPEAAAYERFGRRCGLPRYMKLGTLLSQNLKKGSKGLAGALEKESAVSLEERSAMARKLGEQAGTRLVFPMIIMLGIVLALMMLPAFLSF